MHNNKCVTSTTLYGEQQGIKIASTENCLLLIANCANQQIKHNSYSAILCLVGRVAQGGLKIWDRIALFLLRCGVYSYSSGQRCTRSIQTAVADVRTSTIPIAADRGMRLCHHHTDDKDIASGAICLAHKCFMCIVSSLE